ncbi:MAG: 2-C-methyl-D-erythritol 2,4-cyclodiphosphate synthase [Candidatus Nanopelagicales bacterium]
MFTDLRVGIGVDVHRFDAERPLWLAGLLWPGEPGLAGHSDADVACHAACDALLSAAGLGDLGSNFGTDDPRYADASGGTLLSETAALLRGAGHVAQNVSVQVIGNRPRLSARRDEAATVMAAAAGCHVSVSATTTDGLGLTGRGEGVAAIATALVAIRGSGPL